MAGSAAKAAGRPFVFIDAGANVGLFSFLVASRAGANAKIVAIEPDQQSLNRLRFNAAANPRLDIQIMPNALGETRGKVTLEIDPRDRGGTHTKPAADTSGAGAVECRTLLDTLTEAGVTSIDALKIDTEGAEDQILVPFFRDADRSLWPKLILIEGPQPGWRYDVLGILAKAGYTIAGRTRLNLILRHSELARIAQK